MIQSNLKKLSLASFYNNRSFIKSANNGKLLMYFNSLVEKVERPAIFHVSVGDIVYHINGWFAYTVVSIVDTNVEIEPIEKKYKKKFGGKFVFSDTLKKNTEWTAEERKLKYEMDDIFNNKQKIRDETADEMYNEFIKLKKQFIG